MEEAGDPVEEAVAKVPSGEMRVVGLGGACGGGWKRDVEIV